jgi:hypothetical protein
MATLYVTEFPPNMPSALQVASMPPIAEQTVAIGVGSAASNAFNGATGLVRLHADVVCSVAFGASPTAAATNARLAAGQTEYFAVRPGMKVAVITNT